MYKKISLLILIGYYSGTSPLPSPRVLGALATRLFSRAFKPVATQSLSLTAKLAITQSGLILGTAGIYAFFHNYIPQKNPLSPYTVNLMWVNKTSNSHQKYVIGSRWDQAANQNPALWNDINKDALLPIFQWAQVSSPKAEVVLWYDSNHVSLESIINTQLAIEDHAKNHRSHAPIKLKDLRTLQQVKNNPSIFSSEYPVFFRADLLRLIATHETLKKGKTSYFVYSDLDVTPLSREKLFKPYVKKQLDRYGIVLTARADKTNNPTANDDYENGFHIVRNDKEVMNAIKESLIDTSIARAYARKDSCRKAFLGETVYSAYRLMFTYLYSLKGWGILTNTETKQPYNKNQDGLNPFEIEESSGDTLTFKSNGTNPDLITLPWYPLTRECKYPPIFFGY